MAFKISKNPTFTARVSVMEPNQKRGHDESKFDVVYKFVSDHSELEELKKLSNRDLLERVVTGWKEFVDEDNMPVEFNDTTLQALLSYEPAVLAMAVAFWTSIFKAKEKN